MRISFHLISLRIREGGKISGKGRVFLARGGGGWEGKGREGKKLKLSDAALPFSTQGKEKKLFSCQKRSG